MFENQKKFYLLKILIVSILFYGAIIYENISIQRLYIFIGIFFLYLAMSFIRSKIKNEKIMTLSFLIDVMLVFSVEYYSRYLINYFFHFFYVLILIESSMILSRKRSLILGAVVILVSMIKYIILLYYKANLGNISQMLFFALINISILLIVNFAQYYREEKEKKDKLYKELLTTHRKLKEYSQRIEELATIEERNRIARDLHDTIGHSMTGMIMEIEMIDCMLDENTDEAKKMLSKLKVEARDGLANVREVVETLKPNSDIGSGFEAIKNMVDSFSKKTGLNVQLNFHGEVLNTTPSIDIVLHRTIQEALTNSVRHGKATNVEINLEYKKNSIILNIKDNGVGCGCIEKGFGLKSMEERINSLKGRVKFGCCNGFKIDVFLPLEVDRLD